MLENLPAIMGLATSGVGIAKGATGLAKDLKALVSRPNVDLVETKRHVSNLLDRLVRLQTEQLAMQDELAKLQDDLKKRDRFQANVHRYAMVKTEQGSLIWSLKPDQANGELPHDLCTSCFDNEVKSILQPVGFNKLQCSKCEAIFFKPDGRSSAMIGSLSTRYDVLDPY